MPKDFKRRAQAQMKEQATAEVDLNQLREDFLWCVQRRDSTVFRRQKLNFNSRYCLWPNQSMDGRKWKHPNGALPFPWEGASDARVPLTDLYINQDVATLMVTWLQMKTLCQGVEANDAAFASRLTQVLRWMKYTQMTEAYRETTLCANYMLERGAAVMGVFWEKAQQLGYEEIDLEDVQAIAMQAQQMLQMRASGGASAAASGEEDLQDLARLPQLVMDPSAEERVCALAAQRWPDVRASGLHQAIRDLRTTGTARLVRPYIVKDRPTLVALAPNEEIFLPPEAVDIQTARGLHRRELVTETTLLDRMQDETMQYDEEFVYELIASQRGQVTTDFDGNLFHRVQRVNSTGVLNTEKLFELVHSFERKHDENGVPGIYMTVHSAHLSKKKLYAKHLLLDYAHGQYPFLLAERETRGRLLDDARGYGEIASTWQQQIKSEWDARIDRASISTLPPSYHPEGAAPDRWGPGVQIPTSRPDDYGFCEVPGGRPEDSVEVQETVRAFADEYFGRATAPEKQVLMGLMKQHAVNNWLQFHRGVDTQVLQLMQQYMPDQFYYRVVGSAKGKPIHATRDDIQGKFDVTLGFSASNLDPDFVKQKMDLMEQALNMDTTGRVDRDEVLDVVFEMVDPNLGERLLKPGQEGSQGEIDDEMKVFAQICSGLQVDIKKGQAYGLRLNWLNNMLPSNRTAQKLYAEDPNFKQNIERRLQQLQFQEQQRENAITGKFLGTKMAVQPQGSPLGEG